MDNYYLNKRSMGTMLLPWQQKFCDGQMYFIFLICKLSVKSDSYLVRNNSINFLQNSLFNIVTSQILVDARVQCLANYADLAIFNPL